VEAAASAERSRLMPASIERRACKRAPDATHSNRRWPR
jgi:hypothetical protein